MPDEISSLVDMIERAEADWENKPHVICSDCGAEFVADDNGNPPEHPETCKVIQEAMEEKERGY